MKNLGKASQNNKMRQELNFMMHLKTDFLTVYRKQHQQNKSTSELTNVFLWINIFIWLQELDRD